jgi:isopentenyl-diphosphate delta-isomerase
MTDPINERKLEHLRIVRSDRETDRRRHYFDDIRLTHRALPEIDLRDVDPSLVFMGRRLSFPLLISSMTGGDHETVRKINRNLAAAAEQTGVAMGVGSQRVMFSNPSARSSFELRKMAPKSLLFANLGAVQLNCGFTVDQCRDAIETVGADALVLHLNPLQEAVQPDGNTNFAGLARKIREVAERLDQPVVLKEVGAGLSVADAQQVIPSVKYLDVAGAGGTSWSRIEHHARVEADRQNLGLVFQDWGIPTPQALIALKPLRDRVTLIGSGGIRTGLDMAKAMALGASLCGLAAPFLEPALESAECVVGVIETLRREFVTALFLLGIRTAKELIGNDGLAERDGRP